MKGMTKINGFDELARAIVARDYQGNDDQGNDFQEGT